MTVIRKADGGVGMTLENPNREDAPYSSAPGAYGDIAAERVESMGRQLVRLTLRRRTPEVTSETLTLRVQEVQELIGLLTGVVADAKAADGLEPDAGTVR